MKNFCKSIPLLIALGVLVGAGVTYGLFQFKEVGDLNQEKELESNMTGNNKEDLKQTIEQASNKEFVQQEKDATEVKLEIFRSDKYNVYFKYPNEFNIIKPKSYKQTEIPSIPLESPIGSYWRVELQGTTSGNKRAYMFVIDYIEPWSLTGDDTVIFYNKDIDSWIYIPASYEADLHILSGMLRPFQEDDVKDIENPDYKLELLQPKAILGETKQNGIYLFTKGCDLSGYVNQKVTIIGKVRWWYSENLASNPEVVIAVNSKELNYCNARKIKIYPASYSGVVQFSLVHNRRKYVVLVHNINKDKALFILVPTVEGKGDDIAHLWNEFVKTVKDTFTVFK